MRKLGRSAEQARDGFHAFRHSSYYRAEFDGDFGDPAYGECDTTHWARDTSDWDNSAAKAEHSGIGRQLADYGRNDANFDRQSEHVGHARRCTLRDIAR